jgi:hypothetical protein
MKEPDVETKIIKVQQLLELFVAFHSEMNVAHGSNALG